MKSVYEGIQEKIGEIKDLTDSVHKMLDDVKRNISTRKTNISNLRSFAATAENFQGVGIGGRIGGAGVGMYPRAQTAFVEKHSSWYLHILHFQTILVINLARNSCMMALV